jgi:hypothetical protein
MKHLHHIIPKHVGGTDHPSNLIELSIEEHAEAHRKLYDQYGRKQDKLAWMGLSKMIGGKEIIIELLKAPKSEEHKRKISNAHKGMKKNWLLGNTNAKGNAGISKSEEHKRKISKAHKGMIKLWLFGNKHAIALKGRKKTIAHQEAINRALNNVEVKQKISASWNNKTIVKCPHCNLEGKEGHNMKRYHFNNCKRNFKND